MVAGNEIEKDHGGGYDVAAVVVHHQGADSVAEAGFHKRG